MTTENRLLYAAYLIASITYFVVVHSLLILLGYTSRLFHDIVSLFEAFHWIIGVLLLVGVPIALLVWVRLIVPTTLVSIGFICVIIAELGSTSPGLVQLGNQILIDSTAYVGMYVNGRYVWLLAAILGGLCEFVVRTRRFWPRGSPVNDRLEMPLNRLDAALLGTLIWGLIGGVALGGISVYLLVRMLLLGPLIVFGLSVVATGVEALSTIVRFPVSSYLLYWPVYLGIVLLVALVEHLSRVITQNMATYRRAT